jgi:hypothetical protein
MKRILVLIAAIFISLCVNAQTVNGIPINDIDVEYVQIVGSSLILSNKLAIEIDFGQENKLFSAGKNTRIKDANGKDMIFNSMIDALNFMTKNGYEFVQAFVVTESSRNVYHYLLRKKKTS